MNYSVITKNKTMKRTLTYNGTPILTYSISYPKFFCAENKTPLKRINNFFFKKANEFANYCETDLFKEAVSDYKESEKNSYPFHEHQADLNYKVTYNETFVLSLYLDRYVFMGGAHGTTKRVAYTFDLKKQDKMNLSEFFMSGTYYTGYILEEINKQIASQLIQNPGIYFEDYETLTKEYFDSKNFYLTPEGMAIFYQQYDIAPYSTGLPTFLLPYKTSGPFYPAQVVK